MSHGKLTTRDVNQLRILKLLRLNPTISRTGLAKRTGLGKATVSTLVSELIDEGVISEGDLGAQTKGAGRRPIQLCLNGDARFAIGIELTGSELIAALVDLCGNPVETRQLVVPDLSVGTAVDLMDKVVRDLIKRCPRDRVLGVGIGVPGPVDHSHSRIIQAVNLGWVDVPLAAMVDEKTNLPTSVLKRQNAGALGEYWYGVGKPKDAVLFVSVGIGIGSGIVIDGKLYQGVSGYSGEIGHMTVVPSGDRCNCGNYGCLETVASASALALRARQRIRDGEDSLLMEHTKGLLDTISSGMVLDAAKCGDQLASEVVTEAAVFLGIAIANAINLMNPSIVVLGGEILNESDLFIQPIRETVRRRACTPCAIGVEIVPARWGVLAAAVGAAALVIDGFFMGAENAMLPESAPSLPMGQI